MGNLPCFLTFPHLFCIYVKSSPLKPKTNENAPDNARFLTLFLPTWGCSLFPGQIFSPSFLV